MESARFSIWLQTEPLREERPQPLVALVDGFAQPERALGFERQPPETLIEDVEPQRTLSERERPTRLAALEEVAADLLEELDLCGAEAP